MGCSPWGRQESGMTEQRTLTLTYTIFPHQNLLLENRSAWRSPGHGSHVVPPSLVLRQVQKPHRQQRCRS